MLLVYCENVSYECGGIDDVESYSAWEQVFNGVARCGSSYRRTRPHWGD